ncbi:hypothetical protein NX84_03350 [Corynebacterium minutissimum]|nr:hypothetical protein NX84_03350 [Corynebacterium minutissimum]
MEQRVALGGGPPTTRFKSKGDVALSAQRCSNGIVGEFVWSGQSTDGEDRICHGGKHDVALVTATGGRISRRRHHHRPRILRALQGGIQARSIDPCRRIRWYAGDDGYVDDVGPGINGILNGCCQAG